MRISDKKKEKISEQIILLLFQESPKPFFTSHIAMEIARDEEFTKAILIALKKKGLVMEIKKNKEGVEYKKRSRWILSNEAYNLYKSKQAKV